MRLTKQTDYSLRVLIYLGVHPGRPATIDEVAAAYGISKNHLMKVVYHLSTEGFLDTQRGRGGGFHLARDPHLIRIGSVVRSTETDFALVECFAPIDEECSIYKSCKLRGVLHEALEAWFTTLDRYTLADLIEPRSKLAELLSVTAPAARKG